MILNLQVDISDEVQKLFWGYSFYKYNEKKSLEAKALFEELFTTLQVELEKEYQSTEQRLQGLDKRLKVLEMYSADAQEVDRAINNLNNRMTGIDSSLNSYKQQQENIAKQAEQLEKTVDQFYEVMEKRQNKFATELKAEVNSEVESLLKRILADDLHETIKTAVDAVVKDYKFPAPDYNAAIKAEVADAVRNIPAPDYSEIIKAEVANAGRNISVPDYSEIIRTEVANTVRNIFGQNFVAFIQSKIADAVKLELQRSQASKATVSSYVYQNKIDKQRETIDAQEKSIKELQEQIKSLTARLSAIEEKSSAATVAPQVRSRPLTISDYSPQAETVLSIRDKNSWQKYKNQLLDIGELENFARNNPDTFHTLSTRLNRIKKAVSKIDPQEFDEYTTETVVDKTVGIAKEFMDLLNACNRAINNPNKDSIAAQKLYNLIEKYLARLGIRPMNFKAGGDYEEWADLGMSEMPLTENTSDRRKHNTLKEINVQPHFICYLDEHDKKARRVFGGQCVAYAYKN